MEVFIEVSQDAIEEIIRRELTFLAKVVKPIHPKDVETFNKLRPAAMVVLKYYGGIWHESDEDEEWVRGKKKQRKTK